MTKKYYVIVEFCDGQKSYYSFFNLKNARAVFKKSQQSEVVKNVSLAKVIE